jgi:acetyl-CoA synthetase
MFFGVVPVLVDEQGNLIDQGLPKQPGDSGHQIKLAGADSRSVYGDHAAHRSTPTSSPSPAYYFTGDGARRDEDGDYWITGRDGRRDSTCPAIAWAPRRWKARWCCMIKVAEAAVVGVPPRRQRPGHLRLCHPHEWRRAQRRVEKAPELENWCSKEIGSNRLAGC